MRAYRKLAKDRERRKAFLQGFQALRDDLLATFRRIGEAELSGYTAVEIIKNSKADVPRETST
jgi:hypothetical protein